MNNDWAWAMVQITALICLTFLLHSCLSGVYG